MLPDELWVYLVEEFLGADERAVMRCVSPDLRSECKERPADRFERRIVRNFRLLRPKAARELAVAMQDLTMHLDQNTFLTITLKITAPALDEHDLWKSTALADHTEAVFEWVCAHLEGRLHAWTDVFWQSRQLAQRWAASHVKEIIRLEENRGARVSHSVCLGDLNVSDVMQHLPTFSSDKRRRVRQ